ncbi:helix-turn-helix domain-containing protein [Nocardia aurea]|uniref:helix-turn-helix domain-containing protein n=1 Tax=Nocardia aurea TaxID=2144174 RepID=UPI0033BE7EB0
MDVRQHIVRLLRRAGVRVSGGDNQELVIAGPRGPVTLQVKVSQRRLTVSRLGISEPAAPRTLYVAPSAAAGVEKAARAGVVDLLTSDPPLVILDGEVLLGPAAAGRNLGRTAWGRWAVQRILAVAREPMTQTELATIVGVSQQAVSNALRRIPEAVHGGDGWSAPTDLLDTWLRAYPGPGGAVAAWYGLDDPASQADAALGLLSELALPSALSGDLAADMLSPWRIPSTVRLYVPEHVDFTPIGMSPAEASDATMVIVVPEDPTVFHVASRRGPRAGKLLADPAIVLWDLLNTSTGPAVEEAAATLRSAIGEGAVHV